MLLLFVLFHVINVTSLGRNLQVNTTLMLRWAMYKDKFHKSYHSTAEEERHARIFVSNLKRMAEHNYLFDRGVYSFAVGVNEYSDMEQHQFVAYTLCITENTQHVDVVSCRSATPGSNALPSAVDWRQKGWVTAVKSQGGCKSCWAFSAAGALEGQMVRNHKVIEDLSVQQLVDCSGAWNNSGCSGGLPELAFKYIIDKGGIENDALYPYRSTVGHCNFIRNHVAMTARQFCRLPASEQTLQRFVANKGPISVLIDARYMQDYKVGVFYDQRCDSNALNHAVLVVGYGTDRRTGYDYWLVKNSWGSQWGEDGYIRIRRNANNHCGIATRAVFVQY